MVSTEPINSANVQELFSERALAALERKLSFVGEMITASEVLSHPFQMLGKEREERGWQVEDGTGIQTIPLFPPPRRCRFRNNDNNKRANSRATMKMTNCGADPLDE